MSEFTTDDEPGEIQDTRTRKVDFTTDSDSDSDSDEIKDNLLDNRPVDFTIDDVPDDIQDIRLVGLLHIEILRAGNMVSTNDELQDRANALKTKNHVAYWAYIHPADITLERSSIRFSMEVVNPDASFGSTDARYAPSDRRSVPSFDSTFSTWGEPTSPGDAPPSDDMPPDDASPSIPGGSGSSRDAASVFSASQLVAKLPEGAPAYGTFSIKVRRYAGESKSAITFFTLPIIGEPRFRDFLNSLRVRHMFPFYFPKLGFAYLGCRHFASESVEAWKQDEYILDRCTTTGGLFRDLIGVRYTLLKGLPADPLASSDEGGSEEVSGMRKTPNPIDRGSFPAEFQSLTAGYPFAR